NEHLTIRGVRFSDVGHRQPARLIELQLGIDLIGNCRDAANAVARSSDVAGLNHEAFDHAMKGESVIKRLPYQSAGLVGGRFRAARQRHKILHRNRRFVFEQLYRYGSHRRVENGVQPRRWPLARGLPERGEAHGKADNQAKKRSHGSKFILRPMNRFFLLAAIPALLFAGVASAADVSGTWRGVIEVNHGGGAPTVNAPIRLRLEQKGNALTGDIGHEAAEMKPVPIESGRVEGNEIYFEASSEETNGPIRFRLKL